jgi:Leucine-rich repeat (LRR) protein
MIQPTTEAIQCPEECRCEWDGYYVNCSHSRLNHIPSILPTHVRELVLDSNNISVFVNDNFVSRGLVKLKRIKADYCKIRIIESGSFNGLKILTYLSLESNEIIGIIPGTFEKISRLEYLHLDSNKINHLEIDVFRGLVNLKIINLKGNDLRYLNPDTFVGLPNLQSLYLSENRGLQVPADRHFINSHSLKHLYISKCNIGSVSVETFANVSALEKLDLKRNNLRSLDINTLKVLP